MGRKKEITILWKAMDNKTNIYKLQKDKNQFLVVA